jgi:hypothetical protein
MDGMESEGREGDVEEDRECREETEKEEKKEEEGGGC